MPSRDYRIDYLRLDTRSGAVDGEFQALGDGVGGVVPLAGGAPVNWEAPASPKIFALRNTLDSSFRTLWGLDPDRSSPVWENLGVTSFPEEIGQSCLMIDRNASRAFYLRAGRPGQLLAQDLDPTTLAPIGTAETLLSGGIAQNTMALDYDLGRVYITGAGAFDAARWVSYDGAASGADVPRFAANIWRDGGLTYYKAGTPDDGDPLTNDPAQLEFGVWDGVSEEAIGRPPGFDSGAKEVGFDPSEGAAGTLFVDYVSNQKWKLDVASGTATQLASPGGGARGGPIADPVGKRVFTFDYAPGQVYQQDYDGNNTGAVGDALSGVSWICWAAPNTGYVAP